MTIDPTLTAPTLTALASAALAGVSALLLVRDPGRQLRRAVPRGHPAARAGAPFVRLITGRPDAPALPRRALTAIVGAFSVCLALSGLDSGPGLVVWAGFVPLALAAAIGLGWLEPLQTRRRQQVLITQTPQALELLAACLAAGMPVRTGCEAVRDAFDGPVAEDLGQVLAVVRLGASDADAWRALSDHPQLGPAAVDLARSVESGTMMVEGLRHHAEVARQRRRAGLQVRARAVGVRSVMPLMVCFIPSFMLLGVVPTVVSAVMHALG